MKKFKPFLKHLSFALAFILILILQKSVTLSGFSLNLSLAFITCLAIILSPFEAIIWGAAGGLCIDFISSMPLSMNALIYMFLSFGISIFARSFYKKKWSIIIMFLALSSFLYNLSVYLVLSLTTRFAGFISILWTVMLPDITVVIILGYLLYKLLEKIDEYYV